MQLSKFKTLGKTAVVAAAFIVGGLTISANANASIVQDNVQHTAIYNSGNGHVNIGNKQISSNQATTSVQAKINIIRANSMRNGNNNNAQMQGSNYVGTESGIEGIDFNRPTYKR